MCSCFNRIFQPYWTLTWHLVSNVELLQPILPIGYQNEEKPTMRIFQCNLGFSIISWPLIKGPRVEPRSNLFGPSHDRNHSRTSSGTYSWNQHSFFLIYNKHLKLRYMDQIIPLVQTLVNTDTQRFTMMIHSIRFF